jgi:hypothetical protein
MSWNKESPTKFYLLIPMSFIAKARVRPKQQLNAKKNFAAAFP